MTRRAAPAVMTDELRRKQERMIGVAAAPPKRTRRSLQRLARELEAIIAAGQKLMASEPYLEADQVTRNCIRFGLAGVEDGLELVRLDLSHGAGDAPSAEPMAEH